MRRGKSTFTGCQRQADTLYSSLRSRLVRFHTRAKDIIAATSILLLITAIVGWVLIFDEPTLSPASLLGDYLLSRLSTEGASNLSFTSIERNLFANLTINNLSYRREKTYQSRSTKRIWRAGSSTCFFPSSPRSRSSRFHFRNRRYTSVPITSPAKRRTQFPAFFVPGYAAFNLKRSEPKVLLKRRFRSERSRSLISM